ncbi:MAG TPA: glycosyltransferase family 4 protein, partial [Candidatus Polarisedimenticolia bacterium]|nr:glycosyltransferase family 4 protein [Candidatus Polarisedimenticolia bacterium]
VPVRRCRRVRVIPTGLPPIDFLDRDSARAALDLPRDRFIAVVVGRVERDKGCEEALAALPAIREAAPGALLVFLGPEDPASAGSLTQRLRAAGAGLSGAVLFLGDRPEAWRCLRAFDLLLHPSRHEALPRVLIEALFAAVPVVACAVGGVPEVIEAGRSGLLVPPGQPRALAAAAASLARDRDLRLRLAGAGVQRAAERFSIDTMTRGILAAYDDLTRGARGGIVAAPGVAR